VACADQWLSGKRPTNMANITISTICGDFHAGVFRSAAVHPLGGHNANTALSSASRRCFLGGSPELTGGVFTADDPTGRWLQWPGAVNPTLAALRPLEAPYLFPITRALNPNFKGVIYVDGDVVISGVLRGRVTVAATGNIVIGDDIIYATQNPTSCNDILGLFAGVDVVISDNTINAPFQLGGANPWRTYDDTGDEFVNGIVLALGVFTVENYNQAPGAGAEACQGQPWGRGCLFLTGGIIQFQRGPVGTTGGTGNSKRYAYNQCGLTDPPPYFPTTGRFDRGRYYEVNPVNFNVANLYAALTP
jgi:hypothetical protein